MARVQIIVFEIDGREFGMEATRVSGILRAKKYDIQKIPSSAVALEGMISVRGKVHYVFNLRSVLKIEDCSIPEEGKILMVYVNNLILGCIVDEVTDILVFNSDEFEPAPSFAQGKENQYINGIGKVDERLIVMINIDALLTSSGVDEVSIDNFQVAANPSAST